MNWKEQVAVVTGAADGIGYGIAFALAKRGCRIACLDIADEKNEKTAAALSGAAGKECRAYHCDMADPESIEEVFDRILKDFGRIDILVNNAGVFSTMSFVEDSYETALENYHFNMDVNARGLFLCAKKAAPHMAERGYGHIIKNNLSHKPRSSGKHIIDVNQVECEIANNSFLPIEMTVTDDDFISLDAGQLTLSRKADGSLPDIDFLRLKSDSKLSNAGLGCFIGKENEDTAYDWLEEAAIHVEGNIAKVVGVGAEAFTRFYVNGKECSLSEGQIDLSSYSGEIDLKATTDNGGIAKLKIVR